MENTEITRPKSESDILEKAYVHHRAWQETYDGLIDAEYLRNFTHEMKLNPMPFASIKDGRKTIELRLYDEKRRKLKVGDEIVFTNTADETDRLKVTVKALHTFDSFAELYRRLPLTKCGYAPEDVADAKPSDMDTYYTPEMQRRYGVVGIEIESGVKHMEKIGKTITLKDQTTAILRTPEPKHDAIGMLEFIKTCASETNFILRYPEECTETLEDEMLFIERNVNSDYSAMIVCEVNGRIVGNCQLSLNRRLKVRHRASLAISIISEFWGKGIGTALLEELCKIAKEKGVEQLELEYIDGNERGRRLYEKLGFVEYGKRPNSIRLKDGTSCAEVLMLKML